MRTTRHSVKAVVVLSMFFMAAGIAHAQTAQPQPTAFPISGEIKNNGSNVRTDSRVTAEIICTLGRGEPVEILSQLYDWYKIRLPQSAPAFIKKNFVAPFDNNSIKVLGNNVNIRLRPDESAPILGKAHADAILQIVSSEGEWFRIQPPSQCVGWVNVKVTHPFRTGIKPDKKKEEGLTPLAPVPGNEVTLEGIVEPSGKVFRRTATHKLAVKNGATSQVYLLRGSTRANLNALNYRRVSITGMLRNEARQPYQIIDITSIELLE